MKGLIVSSLIVITGVGGIGAVVAGWRFPAWGGAVIAGAAGINLVACWLAFVPIVSAIRWSKRVLPVAVVSATAIRLVLVSLMGWATCAYGPWATDVMVVWLVMFYLSLLMVETVWAVRLVNRKPDGVDGSATI